MKRIFEVRMDQGLCSSRAYRAVARLYGDATGTGCLAKCQGIHEREGGWVFDVPYVTLIAG